MTETDKAVEFSRRAGVQHVDVRRMYAGKRSATTLLSFCGNDLGTKTELYHRNKVVCTYYILPPIPENVKNRMKGY